MTSLTAKISFCYIRPWVCRPCHFAFCAVDGAGVRAAVRRVEAPLALANEHPVLLQHVRSQRRSDVHPDVPRRDLLAGTDSNLGPNFNGVALTSRADYAFGV